MNSTQHRSVLETLSILVAVIFACCLAAQAQSGRRSTGKSTRPAPSVSESKEVEAKPQKPPKLQLRVGMEAASSFSVIPFQVHDTILDICIRRLSEVPEVLATSAGRNMTRGDAVRAAKEEKERYVVWLQVGDDLADSAPQVRNGRTELYVNYMILEPVTGKIKRMGRTYQGISKVGNVGISGPTSSRRSPVYSEYLLKQSAREAAEKILEAFDIKLREERWPR
jgi:hypothetical protein